MAEYGELASFYDALTRDVDYEAIADWYEKGFAACGKVSSVLDLCCGTATVSLILAGRGYDIIAADASSDMLSIAQEKAFEHSFAHTPLFLNQAAEELDLYGTVDAAVCSLDSINYLSPEALREAVRRVELFLEPGGVFMFDVNTPLKFERMDSQTFIDETDDIFCVWRAELDRSNKTCNYGIDFFSRSSGQKWDRSFEEHTEFIYGREELADILEKAGFISAETVPAPWENGKDGVTRECWTARKKGVFHGG